MSSQSQDLADRVAEFFNRNGGTYQDYVLVADVQPPRLLRTAPVIGLVTFADEKLEEVCRQVLIHKKARVFKNLAEFKNAYGMHHLRDDDWLAYESPRFYTVEHPQTWRIRREGNIFHISPPDGDGSVTISTFESVPLASLQPLMERTLRDFEAVRPLEPIRRNGCEGLQGEYLQATEAGMRSWLVIGAWKENTLVLITANEQEETMPSLRPTYERILNSLTLTIPPGDPALNS